jgi:hypothetical protein
VAKRMIYSETQSARTVHHDCDQNVLHAARASDSRFQFAVFDDMNPCSPVQRRNIYVESAASIAMVEKWQE